MRNAFRALFVVGWFVASIVGAGAEQGFRVGKDGVTPQVYVGTNPATYVAVTWPNIVETDTTGGFNTATGTWTAQAPGVFITGWQAWNQNGVINNVDAVTKITKNGGGPLDTGAIDGPGGYPKTSSPSGTMRYRVAKGDVFAIINSAAPASPASFIGFISGTAFNIGGTITGTVAIGQAVGPPAIPGTIITGGSGLYWSVNISQSFGPGPMNSGLIVIDPRTEHTYWWGSFTPD